MRNQWRSDAAVAVPMRAMAHLAGLKTGAHNEEGRMDMTRDFNRRKRYDERIYPDFTRVFARCSRP